MPKKIAILRFSALGDVAMLMPVLRIAKKQYPDIEMHIFTKKPFDQIFHLADIKATGIKFDRDYKGILGLRKLAKEIDQQDFDMILDMHSVLRTFILEIFCNKQFHRLDKGRKDKSAMIKAKNRPEKPLLSMRERYAAVFKKTGIKLNLHTQLHPIAIKKLPGLPCSTNFSRPFIGIAPFSAHQSKEYPLEKMKMVIREIQSEIKLNILLFGGGKMEEEKLNKLAECLFYGRCFKLTRSDQMDESVKIDDIYGFRKWSFSCCYGNSGYYYLGRNTSLFRVSGL